MMTNKKPAPKKTLRVAANSGETESMAILKNVRREKMAQNLAKGMCANASHTAAGYKATGNSAESAAAGWARKVQESSR